MKSKNIYILAALMLVSATLFIVKKNEANKPQPKSADRESSLFNNRTYEKNAQKRPARRSSTPKPHTEWEHQIDIALGSDSISKQKATQILLKVVTNSRVPLQTRSDALEHSLNLIEDEDYSKIINIIKPGMTELPLKLIQTILDDTLNRCSENQLSVALRILPGSHKEVIDEARDLLEFHLDTDHGDNLSLWKNEVEVYLTNKLRKPNIPSTD